MRIFATLFLCAALSFSAVAQPVDRSERIVEAWRAWAQDGGTDEATIAVVRAGRVVESAGIGVAPDKPMPLASLSKAITAACLAKISEGGGLSMEAPIGNVLDVSAGVKTATLAQLLTHTAGIWPDSTQGNADLRGTGNVRIGDVSHKALNRDEQLGEVGIFAYNNENYAILGAVIERLTGVPYAQACSALVLEHLGIDSASIQGEWAAHGSWGGWSMSAPDFARFAWATFGPNGVIGAKPDEWPANPLAGGAHYGAGVLWREIQDHHLVWSSGMLCWGGRGDGGYFARYGDEWLVVALYADCLDGTARLGQLDEALFKAAVR